IKYRCYKMKFRVLSTLFLLTFAKQTYEGSVGKKQKPFSILEIKYRCYKMKFRVLSTLFLLTFANGICESEDFIHQRPLLVAEFGSSVILPCSHSDDFINSVSWYKHSFGKKPLLIAYSEHGSGIISNGL
ncbi:hypothetical protein cypCar_00015068, partial [Cyprinus carpio]